MKRRRALRRLALFVLVLVSLVAIAIVGAGTSTYFLRWMVAFVDDGLPIQLERVDGSLLGGLRIGRITGDQDGIQFDVEDFELIVDWRCLPRSRICVDLLKAGRVDVQVPEQAEQGESPSRDDEAFWPPDTTLDNVAVQSLTISQGETVEQLNGLLLSAELEGSQLALRRFSGEHRYGYWQAAGRYERRGDWRAELTWEASSALSALLGEGLPKTYSLRAEGDSRSMTGSLLSEEDSELGIDLQLEGLPEAPTWSADIRHGRLFSLRSPDSIRNWIQPSGALHVAGSYVTGVLTTRFNQELTGFADAPKALRASLRLEDRLLLLEEVSLGDEQKPMLEISGELGVLDDLQPALRVVLDDFHAPVVAGFPLEGITGALELDLDPKRNAYSLQTDELSAQQDTRRLLVSGRLASDDDLLLPIGEARIVAADATSGGAETGKTLELFYQRAGQADAAAITLGGDLVVGDLSLDSVELAISSGAERQIDASLRGDVDGDLRATVAATDEGLALALLPTVVAVAGEELRIPETVAARWDADSGLIAMDSLCLLWRNSRLCSEPAVLGESGQLDASLVVNESYDGDWADNPFRMAGRGNGSATVRWADGELSEAGFSLILDALEFDPLVATDTAAPLSWQRVEVRGGLEDARFLEAKLRSERLGDLDLSLREDQGQLSGSLRAASLAIRPWTDLVPELGFQGGTGTADLSVGGTLDSPQLYGQVMLQDVAASIEQAGTTLTDTQLTLEAQGQELSFSGLGLLGGGRLELTGVCCEQGQMAARINGSGNTIGLNNGLSARLSPELDLTVSSDALGVRGLVTVHEGVFEHRSPRDEGVAISPDIQRVDNTESGPRRFAFDADLRTIIEPRFTLRSQEIESTLDGDLRVQVKDREPMQVYGDLRVLGGELRALGQVLRLSEGVVGFIGDPMNPNLNLSAEREIRSEGLRVGFKVQGNLEAPDLTLFSDPPRSERDTLSFLIRGRGPDAGATVDSTAMALSLGATAVNRSGVLRSLESIPGLSDVSIGAEGSDDELAATISAYVGRRLFLSYGVGLYEPVNALTARLYLQSRLWLEVVSRLESSFDLYYRFERN